MNRERSFLPNEFWLVCFLIAGFLAFRVFLSCSLFFRFAELSDHIQYLGPSLLGHIHYDIRSFPPNSMPAGGWPWLDRITLAIGLNLASLFPIDKVLVAPFHSALISSLVLVFGCLWVYRRTNVFGVLVFGSLYNSCLLVNQIGGEILPEGTLVLSALLAFTILFKEEDKISGTSALWSGCFAAAAVFSKVPGIIVPLFLGSYLLFYKKDVKLASQFVLGAIFGTAIVFLLFATLFGFEELKETFLLFFGANLKTNYVGRPNYNNFVSYLPVMFSMKQLPLFPFLFIAVGALRRKSAPTFLLAWSFIVIIYAIYYLTERGYVPLPRYIYPAAAFAALCCGDYYGRLFEAASMETLRGRLLSWALIVTVFLLCGAGFFIGHSFDPVRAFTPANLGDYPRSVGTLYGLGAIGLLILMLSIEVKPRQSLLLSFLFLASLWTSAYCGGAAIRTITKKKAPQIEWFYRNGTLPLVIKEKDADIYLSAWKKNKRAYRVSWIYHFFFESLHQLPDSEIDPATKRSVRVFRKPEQLKKKGRAPVVVTDDLPLLSKTLDETLVPIRQFTWNSHDLVIARREKKAP